MSFKWTRHCLSLECKWYFQYSLQWPVSSLTRFMPNLLLDFETLMIKCTIYITRLAANHLSGSCCSHSNKLATLWARTINVSIVFGVKLSPSICVCKDGRMALQHQIRYKIMCCPRSATSHRLRVASVIIFIWPICNRALLVVLQPDAAAASVTYHTNCGDLRTAITPR